MKRTISAYELVQAYRQEHNTLPTFGIECTELQFYADAHSYEMPPDDELLSVVQWMRQERAGQQRLFS